MIDRLMTAATLVAVLTLGYVLHTTRTRSPEPAFAVGDTLPAVVDYARAPRTLLLVTASTCGYCTASMPFYRRLEPAAVAAGVEMVALTAEDVTVNAGYLREHALSASVVRLTDNALRVRGTPTLLLVNANGQLLGQWVGKLSARDETAVMTALMEAR